MPQFIHQVADRLQTVEGIVAFSGKRNCEATTLGGSRARGSHTPKSDVDLGLYSQSENPPDFFALNHLASELDDNVLARNHHSCGIRCQAHLKES